MTAENGSPSEKSNDESQNKRDWGIYEGPWPYKCATQLPDEEVLPRLRRYLELGERRLPYFLKPMKELSATEQLAVVAAINACASSIFNQCTTVRGQWERTYQPDLTSPNNKEKLKKFGKIIKNYPEAELLPLLESLASKGNQTEAYQVLKSIRKLAHVNKNGTRRNSGDSAEGTEEPPSKKKQRVAEPHVDKSPTHYTSTFHHHRSSYERERIMPGLMRAAEEESRREFREEEYEGYSHSHSYRLPPISYSHGNPAPPSESELSSENSLLRSEIRSMTAELFDLRRRVAYYEGAGHYNYPPPLAPIRPAPYSESSYFPPPAYPMHERSPPRSILNSDKHN